MGPDVLSGRALCRCAVARNVRWGWFSGGAVALGNANTRITRFRHVFDQYTLVSIKWVRRLINLLVRLFSRIRLFPYPTPLHPSRTGYSYTPGFGAPPPLTLTVRSLESVMHRVPSQLTARPAAVRYKAPGVQVQNPGRAMSDREGDRTSREAVPRRLHCTDGTNERTVPYSAGARHRKQRSRGLPHGLCRVCDPRLAPPWLL